MKKIAIISSGYFPVPAVKGGAVETLIQNLIDENEIQKKLDLTVFTTFDELAFRESEKYLNCKFILIKTLKIIEIFDILIYFIFKNIFRVKKHMSFRYITKRIYYIYCVSKKITELDFDEIIIENTSTLFWVLKLFNNKIKYNKKYSYHLHNEVSSVFGCKDIVLNSKRVIGISEFVNKSFITKFPENLVDEIVVLKNCIDTDRFKNNKQLNIRKKYKIDEKDILFIFVGRLCEEKGIKETLKAFSKLQYENIKLMIVGNYYFGTDMVSDFEKELYDIAKGIEDKVIFTGFVHNSILGSYYLESDIAVLPSMWEEPAGLTIVEAMSCGLPIITTNSGGISEYADNNCAIFIEKEINPIENLRNAMEKLYKDKGLREKMSKNAIKNSQKYGKNKYLDNLVDILNNNEN